jgi:hypothetical protein
MECERISAVRCRIPRAELSPIVGALNEAASGFQRMDSSREPTFDERQLAGKLKGILSNISAREVATVVLQASEIDLLTKSLRDVLSEFGLGEIDARIGCTVDEAKVFLQTLESA